MHITKLWADQDRINNETTFWFDVDGTKYGLLVSRAIEGGNRQSMLLDASARPTCNDAVEQQLDRFMKIN